jgi:hypothetical protein
MEKTEVRGKIYSEYFYEIRMTLFPLLFFLLSIAFNLGSLKAHRLQHIDLCISIGKYACGSRFPTERLAGNVK